ncbi:uncharacterized protein LOC125622953 isoform X4 [Caretta caretta]|uniref:uncharacterized protein LOC125622953 isoform X4 n=1 Tax=Caretta caretta TaxID=8467 RepID=UPI003F4BDC5F
MALLVSVLVLSFLQEVFVSLGSRENPPMISVTEGEPISFECSFDGSPAVGNPFYEIIWMYEMTHKNVSKRILSFRMIRPNTSVPVSITEGHFRGQLDFEKNTSSLFIPEVRVNDSGLYYCEVIIVPLPVKSRTNGTHLIVTVKRRIQAKKPEVSLEMSDPICSTPAPAQRDSFTQPVGHEMIYSKLQWSEYSMVSSPTGSSHAGEPVTKKKPRAGTSDPGTDTVYAVLQAP